jgi:hypothetical protein
MTVRLTATDAQMFWMSAKVPNDQIALYAFDGVPPRIEEALAAVRRRARTCHDLRLRIVDDCSVRYPAWVFGDVEESQFVLHGGLDWAACLDTMAALADDQLDVCRAAWRLHVFAPVADVPGAAAAATVVALQISHALADGTRGADLAGWLFGRAVPVPAIVAAPRGSLLLRSLTAARTHRELVRDTESGVLAAAGAPRTPLLTNSAPVGLRQVRTVIRHRSMLTSVRNAPATVTVSVLAAVGTALAGYLRERGQDPSHLAAEVPMAYAGIRHAHNHFRSIGVTMFPDAPPAERAELIAAQLLAGRQRGGHPASLAERRAFAAVPAPLLRWGVGLFDETARSPVVTGHTVVSSVNRGPADLHFGDAAVLFTAGYPGLSPMMGLVHGVHGIGDTVAISVHAAESAGDIDEYVARLVAALG